MKFTQQLQSAILLKRYKRFLADVVLPDGRLITVHCPNSGSMRGCSKPGSQVMISRSANPNRKYPHTLEMIKVDSSWVGINTNLTNRIVEEALCQGIVDEIGSIDRIRREVKVSKNSRLDFMLTKEGQQIFIEVKNCTLTELKTAMFPDAITKRGTKHLKELLALKQSGYDAAVFFCVQRMDADFFAAAGHIDAEYAKTLAEVHLQDVMVLAYQAEVLPEQIKIIRKLPVRF